MKIIIAPAKTMKQDSDTLAAESVPVCLEQTAYLLDYLRKQDADSLKRIWEAGPKIIEENRQRIFTADLTKNLSPAILAYDGIQYRNIAAKTMTQPQLDYLQEHLRILSGFYGILKPLDGIISYRLEMKAAVDLPQGDLYDFWNTQLYKLLCDPSRQIVNLASTEYSKAVTPYLQKEDHMVTCIFGQLKNRKVTQPSVHAKAARGKMVRWLAENQVTDLQKITEFREDGYTYHPELSDAEHFVFLH